MAGVEILRRCDGVLLCERNLKVPPLFSNLIRGIERKTTK